MPTVGWILESDIDRYLSSQLSTPDPGPPLPPRHYCPFCHASFDNDEELRGHLATKHKANRPYLLIREQEPSREDVIRSELRPDEIQMFNVTSIGISHSGDANYESLPVEQLSKSFSKISSGRIWLRLENRFDESAREVVEKYDLSFRIYNQQQLASVDQKFIELLARPDPRIADVDEFLRSTAVDDASEYSSALGDYVLGVLNKDNDPASGMRAGRHDYRRKLNSSLRVLKGFDRPLARLVSALIRFSSNDFSCCYPTGLAFLDLANRQLLKTTKYSNSIANFSVQADENYGKKTVSVVPLDNGSDTVMRWSQLLSQMPRWTAEVEESLQAQVELPSSDPLDRAKLSVLWATASCRLGKFDAAIAPLQRLVNNDCFGEWAEARLAEIEK